MIIWLLIIYFKDEVGNVTEKSINNSAVTLVGSLDGEKTKVEINNIPSDKSTKEYQFSKDNINWITSDSNSYSFDDLGSENTLYGRVVYTDNNVDTYSIDSTNFAVAKLNEINYSSLNAAVKKVSGKEKSTVYLLKDICENINVTEDKNISLDLQSHSVSCSDNTTALLTNNGSLEIKNGNISNNLKTIINNGSITQLSGTISSTLEDNPTVINNPSASYTLNDGVISSKKSNAFVNQGTYIMNGGTISSDIDGLIFANMGGEATFTTGNIISSSQSSTLIYNRVGTVNLNGINLSNQNNVLFNGDSNGYHEAILNINGGSFSTNGIAIDNYAVINHKGGTISSDNDTSVTVLNEENSTYNLDGGSISSEKSNAIRNNGILKMLSGNLTSAGSFPTLANDNGTSTLKGGTITNTGTEALVYNATGTVNLEGIELSNTNLVIKNGEEDITTGTININSGTVSSEDKAAIRNYGIISHSGGTVSSNSTSELTVNNQATGSYTLSGGSITSSASNAFINLGTFEMTSGTITTDGNYPTYVNNGGTTTFNGGTIIQSQNNKPLIYNKTGTINIEGINLTNKGVAVQNGDHDNTTAILNINSGTISSEEKSAISNYATVNHSGGTVSSNATSYVTVTNQATGSYTLNGGSITSSAANAFSNPGTFVMTSGTMTTDGNAPTYVNIGGTTTFNGGTIIQSQNNSSLVYNKIGTINIDGINLTNKGVAVQNGDHDNTMAILNINSGTISSEEDSAIRNYATVNHSGGTVSSNTTSKVTVANQATGSYTLNGGTIKSLTNTVNNVGAFVMTSGTMNTDGNYPTYYNNGGTSTLKGGNISGLGPQALISNASGTVNFEGINLENDGAIILNKTASASANFSSGTINSKTTYTIANIGTFSQTGGTIKTENTTSGKNYVIYNNGGIYNLKGGNILTTSDGILVYNYKGTSNIESSLTTDNIFLYNGSSSVTTGIVNIKSGNITCGLRCIYNYATINQTGGTIKTLKNPTLNNKSTGTYTLSNGSIINDMGSAVINAGTFKMTSGTVANNSTSNLTTIDNEKGNVTITGGEITTKTTGGTFIFNNGGTMNLSNLTLTGASAILGNGVSVDDSSVLNLTNCNITSTGGLSIANYGSLTITNGSVTSSAANAINNSRKVTLKGNAKITSSIKNYPTIYNKSGATLTKDSTVTVTNTGGGTAIYNAS